MTILVTSTACSAPVQGDCDFEFEEVGVYGAADDSPGAVTGVPKSVAVDSRGRLVVLTSDGLPYVYDEGGSFLGRIGRAGSGPEELASPDLVLIGPNDSVLVFDRGTARMHVYSPDLTLARSVRWPFGPTPAAVSLGSDGVVANVSRPGQASLIHVSMQGDLLAEIGAAGDGFDWYHVLATSGKDGVWFAPRYFESVLNHWDVSSGQLSRLAELPWFRSYDVRLGPNPDSPPTPELLGMWEDAQGLWVVGRAPDANWAEGIGDLRRTEGQPIYDYDPAKVYDTVVELRDGSNAELRAHCRVDIGRGLVLTHSSGLAVPTPTELGFVRIRLLRVR